MSISDTITKLNPYFIRRVLKITEKNCIFNINLCKHLKTIFQNILELLVTHYTIDHWLYNFWKFWKEDELAILDNSALENSLQKKCAHLSVVISINSFALTLGDRRTIFILLFLYIIRNIFLTITTMSIKLLKTAD